MGAGLVAGGADGAVALLPVSGVEIVIDEPCGHDELFLLETASEPVRALVAFSGRVVHLAGGEGTDVATLPAVDLGALALLIRRAWLGDLISSGATCAADGCGEAIDVSFGIGAFLQHHRPRRARGVAPAGDGWYCLAGTEARFRIPTVADVCTARASADPSTALAAACIDAAAIPRGLARRLDRALSAVAPRLEATVGGNCPACGAQVALAFDPVAYSIDELRYAFASLHAETSVLAQAFGWSEEAILALPRSRRRRYASLIASDRAAA
jgi:hypothetical protein